jgi:hypothetical protein
MHRARRARWACFLLLVLISFFRFPELLEHVLVWIVWLFAEDILNKALDSLLQLMMVEVIPRQSHGIIRFLQVVPIGSFAAADSKLHLRRLPI